MAKARGNPKIAEYGKNTQFGRGLNAVECAKASNEAQANNKKLRRMKTNIETARAKQREAQREALSKIKTKKPFINAFGEATKRYVTSTTYERAEKRNSKEIMKFIGG